MQPPAEGCVSQRGGERICLRGGLVAGLRAEGGRAGPRGHRCGRRGRAKGSRIPGPKAGSYNNVRLSDNGLSRLRTREACERYSGERNLPAASKLVELIG